MIAAQIIFMDKKKVLSELYGIERRIPFICAFFINFCVLSELYGIERISKRLLKN